MNPVMIIKALFSSIRPVNLFITALALYMARYTVVIPVLGMADFSSSLSGTDFSLLVMATLLIAAGGYLINDYFDRGIDAVNRPGSNKTDSVLGARRSIIVYVLITLSGLMTSWYLGERTGTRYVLLIHLFSAGLLFFYSQSYKKMLLAGNMVIAFLSGLAIMMTVLCDRHAMMSDPVMTIVSAYAVFAFLMTLVREIIKDCEDLAGDMAFGASTLPAVLGIRAARFIAALLAILVAAAIAWIQVTQSQWENKTAFGYMVVLLQVPLLWLSYRCIRARTGSDDHRNAQTAKWIMVAGILSMPVLYLSSV